MEHHTHQQNAVEVLQELGLKEYEAKCFVALNRLSKGTAKEISTISEVPRTRVYDAVRVLESEGLVEIQHTNPKQFKSVAATEAVSTLDQKFQQRTSALEEELKALKPASTETETGTHYEIWGLSGKVAIANRTEQLIQNAAGEIIFIGTEAAFSDK